MAIEFSTTFREQLALAAAKRTMLRQTPDIETLVLGSSHGDFGFDPAQIEGAFNACCRSQDLKLSYNLYKQLSSRYKTIHTLVLFTSVFSPGSLIEFSPAEREISVVLNEIFDLNLSYEVPFLSELYGHVKGKLGEMTVSLEGFAGFIPTYGKTYFPESYGAERRASEHLKRNASKAALPYLEMILDLVGKLGHRAVVVLSPARSDYRRHAGSGREVFKDIRSIVESRRDPRLRVLDLYDFEGFHDKDFGDFDHLHPQGPGVRIMSRLVRDAVRRPIAIDQAA